MAKLDRDNPLMEALLDKHVLLITGKGGVGKSTVAAAMARLASERGRRVLLLELESVSRVGPLFGLAAVGPQPQQAADNLWVACLQATDLLRFFAMQQLKIAALVNLALRNRAVDSFFRAVPAIKPILFLYQLWHTEVHHGPAGDRQWDLIVCDLPTSGFAAGMYAIPETLMSVFRFGPVGQYGQGMRQMLVDPRRTGLVLVSLPELLPVTETLELHEMLRARYQVETAAVVINGTMPQALKLGELQQAADKLTGTPHEPWLWAAELLQSRHDRGTQAGERLRQSLPGRVLELPYLLRRSLPLAAIDELAAALLREAP